MKRTTTIAALLILLSQPNLYAIPRLPSQSFGEGPGESRAQNNRARETITLSAFDQAFRNYLSLRGPEPETLFNLSRQLHQLSPIGLKLAMAAAAPEVEDKVRRLTAESRQENITVGGLRQVQVAMCRLGAFPLWLPKDVDEALSVAKYRAHERIWLNVMMNAKEQAKALGGQVDGNGPAIGHLADDDVVPAESMYDSIARKNREHLKAARILINKMPLTTDRDAHKEVLRDALRLVEATPTRKVHETIARGLIWDLQNRGRRYAFPHAAENKIAQSEFHRLSLLALKEVFLNRFTSDAVRRVIIDRSMRKEDEDGGRHAGFELQRPIQEMVTRSSSTAIRKFAQGWFEKELASAQRRALHAREDLTGAKYDLERIKDYYPPKLPRFLERLRRKVEDPDTDRNRRRTAFKAFKLGAGALIAAGLANAVPAAARTVNVEDALKAAAAFGATFQAYAMFMNLFGNDLLKRFLAWYAKPQA